MDCKRKEDEVEVSISNRMHWKQHTLGVAT
jgi:hypothetical protein